MSEDVNTGGLHTFRYHNKRLTDEEEEKLREKWRQERLKRKGTEYNSKRYKEIDHKDLRYRKRHYRTNHYDFQSLLTDILIFISIMGILYLVFKFFR